MKQMENHGVKQRHRLSKTEEKELSEKILRLCVSYDVKSIATILGIRVDLVNRLFIALMQDNKIVESQIKKRLIKKNTKVGDIFPNFLREGDLIAIKSDNEIIIRSIQIEDLDY